ncbi:MAG: HPr-rel-A system PqqD family protein [Flavobacterium sp.]|nr:MAG: HPr-rel-A system PqqD family protein [Flavobacterium sp.]
MNIKKNIAISDSGFLFNPSSGDSYSLNPVGQEILKLLKDDKSDEEVVAYILKNYMTDKDAVEKDLYDFKNMLENFKLTEDE